MATTILGTKNGVFKVPQRLRGNNGAACNTTYDSITFPPFSAALPFINMKAYCRTTSSVPPNLNQKDLGIWEPANYTVWCLQNGDSPIFSQEN